MKATTPNGAAIEAQLEKLAATPVPAPRPLFAHQLEDRLRALAAGEVTAAPVPARSATVHRLPVRWMAGVAAAAALVAAVLAIRPSGGQPARVTQVGSHGEVGSGPTTTTAPSTPPSSALSASTTTTRPVPTTTSTTAHRSEPSTTTSSVPAVATSAPAAVTPTSSGATTTSISRSTTTVTVRPAESTTIPSTSTSTTPSTSTTSTTVRSPTLACTPGLAASPQVSCTWSRTTSTSFASYRLQRATADGAFATVFTTTEVATTSYVDTSVATPSSYRYRLDILDSSGSVIASSNVATLTCCNAK